MTTAEVCQQEGIRESKVRWIVREHGVRPRVNGNGCFDWTEESIAALRKILRQMQTRKGEE